MLKGLADKEVRSQLPRFKVDGSARRKNANRWALHRKPLHKVICGDSVGIQIQEHEIKALRVEELQRIFAAIDGLALIAFEPNEELKSKANSVIVFDD